MKKVFQFFLCAVFFVSLSRVAWTMPSDVDLVSISTDSRFWSNDLDEDVKGALVATGLVSWYGPGFQKRLTASGERYDMYDMTCASRTLPFGTLLEITNLANGRKTIARVNDRGPYVAPRILDVSLSVARALDFLKTGVAKVELRKIEQ